MYLKHKQAMESVSKTGSRGVGGGGKYKNSDSKSKKNNNRRKKGALSKTKEWGVSKPKKGGCHRCGGPHFVRACPKPVASE